MVVDSHVSETSRVTVTLADLLDRMAETIQYYCNLPDPSLAVLIACWIANTYTADHFHYCGYLALRSATPRCGKSRLLRLIGSFSKGNPRILILPTAAVLFRSLPGVLLLDEVDNLRNNDKDAHAAVLAVLNSGFERGGTVPRIDRQQGGPFQVVDFAVYGPKAFAGIEKLADTLADRTFSIQMTRTTTRMPRLKPGGRCGHDRVAEQMRERLQAWADQHADHLVDAYN